jgi:hypothetical protein
MRTPGVAAEPNRIAGTQEMEMSENRKSIPLSPEAREVIEHQLAAFRRKFGREPGLTDPIFFDPDSDEPRPISQQKLVQSSARILLDGYGNQTPPMYSNCTVSA